jgi:hypothetical protein
MIWSRRADLARRRGRGHDLCTTCVMHGPRSMMHVSPSNFRRMVLRLACVVENIACFLKIFPEKIMASQIMARLWFD